MSIFVNLCRTLKSSVTLRKHFNAFSYRGRQAFCRTRQGRSVWYFWGWVPWRAPVPKFARGFRRRYGGSFPSTPSCPSQLAYHRRRRQPKNFNVNLHMPKIRRFMFVNPQFSFATGPFPVQSLCMGVGNLMHERSVKLPSTSFSALWFRTYSRVCPVGQFWK